ncbi:MAG: UV damage endonuclease UvsE, partial [Cyanobacteriota bacterium]|nr:UV damage endonuclease UvsE [Cyanobacteriota bacterium]
MNVIQLENSASAQSKHKATLPKLGLVCITVSQEVRFRTITRTRYLQFD